MENTPGRGNRICEGSKKEHGQFKNGEPQKLTTRVRRRVAHDDAGEVDE